MPTDLKPEEGFAGRLRTLIGAESEAAFAARCPEVSRPLLRKYLSGSEPGMSKVIAIARAYGVSVDWLATGEGDMMRGGSAAPPPPAASPAALDEELLARVGEEIADLYRQENARISPRQLARLQAQFYNDLITTYDDPSERVVGLKVMLQQLRRDLRVPPVNESSSKRLA